MGSIIETGTAFPGNTGSIPITVTGSRNAAPEWIHYSRLRKMARTGCMGSKHGRTLHPLAYRAKWRV
ncbi:MAG: hypothetical protein R2764_03955 [Bacteroidales bacterium]